MTSAMILTAVLGLGAFWFVVSGRRIRSLPTPLRFAPFVVSSGILFVYFLTDQGILESLRTEYMFGVFGVLLLPFSFVLLLLQALILFRLHSERAEGPVSPPTDS